MLKQKLIVLGILSFIAISASASILYSDGTLGHKQIDNRMLAVEKSFSPSIALAKETVAPVKPLVVKKPTPPVKKAPVIKKVVPKKKVVAKKKENTYLAPPVITAATAPHSPKR